MNVLGWLVIAHAAMTALFGLVIMFLGQIFQAWVIQNPELFDNDIPPEVAELIAPVAFLIGMLFLLASMPSIAAGVGVLRYRNWGRVLTIVLSVLRILEFPLGTLTAIYSFWVLLSKEGKSFFRERAAQAEV